MVDWGQLRHAYGAASDVPALLARLAPEPEADVWEELWSRLCHQSTVYSASFAALPALVDAAAQWKPGQRNMILALAAGIIASEDVEGHSRYRMRSRRSNVKRWLLPNHLKDPQIHV